MMNAISNVVDYMAGKAPTSTPTQPVCDESNTMHAIIWHGKKDVRYVDKPRPCLTDTKDILLKITATTICGSDLHLYSGGMPCMQDGDILGHEFMGVVEDVGSEVTTIKKGQRVVVAFDIACGECSFCKREEFSACSTTNPSVMQEQMLGKKLRRFMDILILLAEFQADKQNTFAFLSPT